MYNQSQRDILDGHGVAVLRLHLFAGHQDLAGPDILRSQDITLFAVLIANQGDKRRPVRVVLYRLHPARDIILVALEIDNPVLMRVPAADMTAGNLALIITSAGLFKRP